MALNAKYTYEVELEPQEGGPEPELRERLAVVAAHRLPKLEDYPSAGLAFDALDTFEGKYVWEMTPEEFEATPPTQVDFEVVSVDPVEAPADGAAVKVVARVVF
jgi:hypothetical protein